MADTIEFTSNYNDLSTDTGFQFEFVCGRCQSGYRSTFKASATGTANTVLQSASNLFGGVFNSVSNVADNVRSATCQKDRDKAFVEAGKEIQPNFIQCPRCKSWVCRAKCWNDKKGLCKECAPDLGVEMAAAQASKSVEEVWAHAKMAEEDKHLSEADWRKGIRATCPKCEAPLSKNVKFCPECGAKIQADDKCGKCGAKLDPDAKFCGECGEKVG